METLHKWQGLVGAIIGASAPFFLWRLTEVYKQHNKRKDNLYYLHRIIINQINTLVDVRDNITKFINEKLTLLIEHPRGESETSYSVDKAFFPLFSSQSLADDIHIKSTGSNYIDNKIAQAYKVSKDLPLIIGDLRQQFKETLDFNKEISFNRLNSPVIQRKNYLEHLEEYRRVLKVEMLEHNIPHFMKILSEALVSIIELRNIGIIRWKFRFDARYRFYFSKTAYKLDQTKTFENIEKYFESKVNLQIKEFNKI